MNTDTDNQNLASEIPVKTSKSNIIPIIAIILIILLLTIGMFAYSLLNNQKEVAKDMKVNTDNVVNNMSSSVDISLRDKLSNLPELLNKIDLDNGGTLFVIRTSTAQPGCFFGVNCGLFFLDKEDSLKYIGELNNSDGSYDTTADGVIYFYSGNGDAGQYFRDMFAYDSKTSSYSVVASVAGSAFVKPSELVKSPECPENTYPSSITLYIYRNFGGEQYSVYYCDNNVVFRNDDGSHLDVDLNTISFLSDDELKQIAINLGIRSDNIDTTRLSYEDPENVYFEFNGRIVKFTKAKYVPKPNY